jgi:hypothetical protein
MAMPNIKAEATQVMRDVLHDTDNSPSPSAQASPSPLNLSRTVTPTPLNQQLSPHGDSKLLMMPDLGPGQPRVEDLNDSSTPTPRASGMQLGEGLEKAPSRRSEKLVEGILEEELSPRTIPQA